MTYQIPLIENVFLNFEKNITDTQKLDDSEEQTEPPSTIVWVKYFLAQHFSRIGEHEKAIEYIEFAKEHTPTSVEIYAGYAKVLKHAGKIEESSEMASEALSLDLADKYLNTKAIKYLLRADKVEEARKLHSIYTSLFPDKSVAYSNNLVDMQVIWYEQYEADSWLRQGETGKALFMLDRIVKHFQSHWNDQILYHNHQWR